MVLFPSIADMDETSDFEPWVVILVHLPFFSFHVGLPRRLWCEAEAIRVDGLPCGQKNERIVCSEFMRFAAWLLNAAAWEITTHHRMACPFGHAKVLLFHFDWWPFEGRDNSMFLMKIASGTVHVWAWFANTCVILKCVCYHACLRKKNKSGSGCDSVFNSSARHVWSYCVGLELLFELQCFLSPGALDMWYLSIFSNLFWLCCIAFDVFLWTGTVDLGWMNMYNFDANWRIANLDETKTKLCSPQLCLRQLVGAGRVAVGTLRCGPQGLDHAACTGNIRPLIYT